MTPPFIRSDVVNKLQACFPQNKLSSALYKIHWSQCAGVWETSPKGPSAKCETRKMRYIAAHIKFKALMFAYRTSTGSAPLYLNSVLQTFVPREALFCKWTTLYCSSQRDTKSLSLTFTWTVPIWWPAQLNPNSVLSHQDMTPPDS